MKEVTRTESKKKQLLFDFLINASQMLYYFTHIIPMQGSVSIPTECAGRQGVERLRHAREVC